MAVISLFWAWNSLCVACRFWMPCHISRKSWTLAILCNFPSCAPLFVSKPFSVSLISYSGLSPANIPLLARANCLTTIFSRRASPVVFGCLQWIMSHPREKLESTPITYSMIENISHATLQRLAYFECVSSCWHLQSVISGIQNVLLICIGWEW